MTWLLPLTPLLLCSDMCLTPERILSFRIKIHSRQATEVIHIAKCWQVLWKYHMQENLRIPNKTVLYITYLRTEGKKWDLGLLITKLHFLLNEALGIRERRKEEEMKTTKEKESHRTKKPRVWTCLHRSLNSKDISDYLQDSFFFKLWIVSFWLWGFHSTMMPGLL